MKLCVCVCVCTCMWLAPVDIDHSVFTAVFLILGADITHPTADAYEVWLEPAKPNQPNQAKANLTKTKLKPTKPSQAKPSQAKPNQTKQNWTLNLRNRWVHLRYKFSLKQNCWPGMAKIVFCLWLRWAVGRGGPDKSDIPHVLVALLLIGGKSGYKCGMSTLKGSPSAPCHLCALAWVQL